MKFTEINPEDLSPLKLNLISLGGLGGVGVGLFLSIILTSTTAKIVLGVLLFSTSLFTILKNINLLLD